MIWLWILLATLVAFLYFKRSGKRKGLKELPGPRGYPLVGNALQFQKQQIETFNRWTEEFGEIYKFTAGPQTSVVVSNPKLAKEILLNDSNYTGRIQMSGFELYENQALGISNSEGELWEVHRRFLLRQLRDFGFGKAAMQDLIMEELDEVSARLRSAEGKPVHDIKKLLTLAVINSLWSVLTSQRFKHDDPKILQISEHLQKIGTELGDKLGFLFLVVAIPWLKHVIPDLSGYTLMRKLADGNRYFFEDIVKEHKKTFEEDNIRDFIDVYLAEVKKTADPNSKFYGDAAERQLVVIIFDLFMAGSETTSTTLAWAILYITSHKHVQDRLQEEISSVTNNSRSVLVSDRPSMPYTIALIDEVLRCSSIVPTGLPHRSLADKEFQGYFIPKNSLILTNMYYMHHNKKVWGDPEVFRPERFLSDDGKKYQKNENLLPFQIGRRQCVGETLARDTIFLFIANLFQRFTFAFDPNSPEPILNPEPTMTMTPHPYGVVLTDRLRN